MLFVILNMPSIRRRQVSSSQSTSYDMGNINNWYADQFRTKLAEWNIVAPPYFSKAELIFIWQI